MNKKIIILCLFCLITTALPAYVSYACPFLTFNQSISNAAYGIESGTADIIHLDALSIGNNPAKLGLMKGFNISYSNSKYYFAKYRIMKIAFNIKGFGFSLPMYNCEDFDREGFGYTVEHPAQLFTNENGEIYSAFQPIENILPLSIGINIDKLVNKNKFLPDSFEMYLGATVNLIKSKLGPKGIGSVESNADGTTYGSFYEIGSLLTYNPESLQQENQKFEFTFGLKTAFGPKIYYINKSQLNPLPNHTAFGVSAHFSELAYNPIFKENREKLTAYCSMDIRKYSKKRLVFGSGLEIGLLDLLSYRLGYTSYSDQDVKGFSQSAGFHLKLNRDFMFKMDYINMLGDIELGYKDRIDFSLQYGF